MRSRRFFLCGLLGHQRTAKQRIPSSCSRSEDWQVIYPLFFCNSFPSRSLSNALFVCETCGFYLFAGKPEIEKTIREMGKVENGLKVFPVDIMDYQSILVALKGCSGLFCCVDTPHVYDVSPHREKKKADDA